ncbi:MAG: tRNA-dihydrouridine synthase family protein [Lachnospiraceae bacterium]|nr:tRNA-dihydrouridine synthase family protein [Lachnospiraceae bacterium]
MQLYFAPLEGIGGYIYRNAQADFFPKADKYFSPFISPGEKRCLTPRDRRDVAPERNERICLVPQILTNRAELFIETVRELQAFGYGEVNLNLGCPSRTVVTKGRGAGFLGRPEELERFLDEIFANCEVRISVKTRLGMENPEEFVRLLEIFNRYPMEELIIHPRVQTDYYKNVPNREMFSRALSRAYMPVVYNGDIFSPSAFTEFHDEFPDVDAVMMGRGVLADPALFGEVRARWNQRLQEKERTALTQSLSDSPEGYCYQNLTVEVTHDSGIQQSEFRLAKGQLLAFHDRLLSDYESVLFGEKTVLFKMKELWYYMAHGFTNHEKYEKAIRKSKRLTDYRVIVKRIFSEQELQENDF